MRRFLVSSGWIFATSLVLVLVFIPFDPRLSERAQALPGTIVSFNRSITDFGTFSWMLYSTGALAILAYIAARVLQARTYAGRLRNGVAAPCLFFPDDRYGQHSRPYAEIPDRAGAAGASSGNGRL